MQNLSTHICYPYTDNIGDDAQNIPLMLALKSKYKLVPRDSIEQNLQKIKQLMIHGWLSRNSFSRFEISSIAGNSSALSCHIANKQHLEGSWKEFFLSCKHLYTRDHFTLEEMKKAGIEAKFSGCLTMLYGDLFKGAGDQGYILCTENKYLQNLKGRRVIYFNPTNVPRYIQFNTANRIAFVLNWISLIANASIVVSDRLHTLMPAVSLGKSIRFPNINSEHQPTGSINRFWGLINVFKSDDHKENTKFLNEILEKSMYPALDDIGMFNSIEKIRSQKLNVLDCKSNFNKIIDMTDLPQINQKYLDHAFLVGQKIFFDTITCLGFRSYGDLPPIVRYGQNILEESTDPLLEDKTNHREKELYWTGAAGSRF